MVTNPSANPNPNWRSERWEEYDGYVSNGEGLEAQAKLEALKTRIKASGLQVRDPI